MYHRVRLGVRRGRKATDASAGRSSLARPALCSRAVSPGTTSTTGGHDTRDLGITGRGQTRELRFAKSAPAALGSPRDTEQSPQGEGSAIKWVLPLRQAPRRRAYRDGGQSGTIPRES